MASIRPASQRIMCNKDNTEQLSSHAQVPCPTATVRKCRHLPTAHRLATWTLTGTNCVVYEPPVEDILARYYQKFNKGGKLDAIEEYHVGLRDAHTMKEIVRSDHTFCSPPNRGVMLASTAMLPCQL